MASGFIWQMNIENYLKAGGLAKDQFSWLGGGDICQWDTSTVGIGTQHNLNTETRCWKEPKKKSVLPEDS